MHRVGGPQWPTDIEALCRELVPHWPGQVLAYHYLVDAHGRCVRLVPEGWHAPHAYRRNGDAIGIGFVGDFRVQTPTDTQYYAGRALVQDLLRRHPQARLRRHDVLPDGTTHPNKVCPGRHLDMSRLAHT